MKAHRSKTIQSLLTEWCRKNTVKRHSVLQNHQSYQNANID